jgi:hypothetical protein
MSSSQKILTRDGKIVIRDGKIVTVEDAATCECCVAGFILECDPDAEGYDAEIWMGFCHSSPAWFVVQNPDGSEAYNGCPDLDFAKVPVKLNQTVQVRYEPSHCGGVHQCDGATFKLYAIRGKSKAFIGDINLNNKGTGDSVDGGTYTITQEILDALSLP